MSMALVVGEFKVSLDNKLGAEYKELSKNIVITDFIDEVISDYIDDLPVFEKIDEDTYEEVIYKTISLENIAKLAEKVDELQEYYFIKYSSLNGKTEKQDIINHLRNLVQISYIVRETYFYYLKCKDNQTKIKVIIA